MIRHALAAGALLLTFPATAQTTTQDALQARHDRALAAGYKALTLCSAIANPRHMAKRSPEDVVQWELSGIYPQLDPIVRELPHKLTYHATTALSATLGPTLHHVSVDWDAAMPPRVAIYKPYLGCSILPVGAMVPPPVEKPPQVLPGPMPTLDLQYASATRSLVESAFADRYGAGTRTTAVIVQRNSKRVAEQYAEGPFGVATPQRTWSVAKSIASTLVGAAVYRGEADVAASAGLGTDASDPRRAITIDHALRMASGRYSETPGNRTDALYFGGATVRESALDGPLVYLPGTVFRYANNDTLAATQAISASFSTHPPNDVLKSIWMGSTVAETDWQGGYVLSSQVWSTARDLAQLGQLYLDDGILKNGKRVLPEGWVKYVSTPSGPQPDGPFGYGAGFWLLNKSQGVPPDTFAAFGNRGQFIIIVPSMNVVIVRRGEDPAGSSFDIAAFTRDVLESLTQ